LTHTMISWGRADRMVKGNLQMAPGMGLVEGMVIDSHFVKRGRISRLMHLAAENPGILGVGLAEDTGILITITPDVAEFVVIGSRQVVLVDGKEVIHSNMPKIPENYPFSVTNVRVNILGPGYRFNLHTHEIIPSTEKIQIAMHEPEKISDLPYRPITMVE